MPDTPDDIRDGRYHGTRPCPRCGGEAVWVEFDHYSCGDCGGDFAAAEVAAALPAPVVVTDDDGEPE